MKSATTATRGRVEEDEVLEMHDEPRSIRFTKEHADRLPPGWTVPKLAKGEAGIWKQVPDETGPCRTGFVLVQLGESPLGAFNLCLLDDARGQDVELSVAFKAQRTKQTYGGGLVWRYKDPQNYYLACVDPEEGACRIFKFVDGNRTQLSAKSKLPLATGKWHTMKVTQERDHIRCFVDGKLTIELTDSTFAQAGRIGLWTEADARTHFDDFRYAEI